MIAMQLRVHGERALEALSDKILPLVLSWVAMRDAPVFRGVALCVLDDVIEHCCPAGLAIVDQFLPHLLEVRMVSV